MVTTHSTGPMSRRRRKGPSPDSILDRDSLVKVLDEAGLVIKPVHIETFYQALHRQHYPSTLEEFCDEFEQNDKEWEETVRNKLVDSLQEPQQLALTDSNNKSTVPLKNNISKKPTKNKNKRPLPRAFVQFLRTTDKFTMSSSRVARTSTSSNGSTTKLAVELHDGQLVESVVMRHATPYGFSRVTLCVSSQCGCAMGCVSLLLWGILCGSR